MSFIKCNVCSNDCSPLAPSCPKCGQPFNATNKADSRVIGLFQKVPSYFKKQTPTTKKWIALTCVAGVILLSISVVGVRRIVRNFMSTPQLERELCDAALDGDLSKVKLLVESGANVNSTVYKSVNPLMLAILYAAPAKVEESTSESKRTIRLLLVRFLLDSGANSNVGNKQVSPLALARIVDDDAELEELLIRFGATPETVSQEEIFKDKPRKINASIMRLGYQTEALSAIEEDIKQGKRKIIEGK